ncbi:MAG: response regulator transcription factor [Thermodesulfobacteriota bacterium]|nr:response regulator transcription factor [Thermodesulfobacteriota bacterium]
MSLMVQLLIVEDNNDFRKKLKENLLSFLPFLCIQEASDEKEAFEKLHRFCPDLIIMDIDLSGENGLALTEKIKERYPRTVVMILTNHDLPEYRDAAYKKGAKYFFSKETASLKEIIELVESIFSDGGTV